MAADLTDADAPDRIATHIAEHHGRLTVMVNNAGASLRATFADGGYANVSRTMELNFDSVVRLTEKLLPVLRASAPSAIVNVASTAARVARPGAGAHSAFALAGWTDALHAEERPHGVHVGLVLPALLSPKASPPTNCAADGSRDGRRATFGPAPKGMCKPVRLRSGSMSAEEETLRRP